MKPSRMDTHSLHGEWLRLYGFSCIAHGRMLSSLPKQFNRVMELYGLLRVLQNLQVGMGEMSRQGILESKEPECYWLGKILGNGIWMNWSNGSGLIKCLLSI